MRLSLIAALLTSALCFAPLVAAGDAGCRSSVDIEVDDTPFDPPLAKVVFAEVFHAVERSDIGCEDVAGTRLSLTRVTIHWPARDHAALEVEVADGPDHRLMGRDVDLTRVARDARALAITIATTEMIEELRAQVRMARPERTPPASSAAPTAPPPKSPASPHERARTWSFAPTFALDAFTRGLVLLGPDARVSIPIFGVLRSTLRLGTRAAIGDGAPASGFVAGGALEVAWPPRRAPLGVTLGARVDAFDVPYDGVRRVHAVAGVGVGGELRLGRTTSFVVDAGVARALDHEAGDARGPLSGVGVSASAGLSVAF